MGWVKSYLCSMLAAAWLSLSPIARADAPQPAEKPQPVYSVLKTPQWFSLALRRYLMQYPPHQERALSLDYQADQAHIGMDISYDDAVPQGGMHADDSSSLLFPFDDGTLDYDDPLTHRRLSMMQSAGKDYLTDPLQDWWQRISMSMPAWRVSLSAEPYYSTHAGIQLAANGEKNSLRIRISDANNGGIRFARRLGHHHISLDAELENDEFSAAVTYTRRH
jgi:hypothetical protein